MDRRTTVLLVDDEKGVRELTGTYLERVDERIDTVTAADAERARELLADRSIDCVVSDHDMPGTNGLELLEAVREEYPDLPFILFTGKGSEEIASEAVSAGVTDYLQKSTGTDQYEVLANRITNAVDRADAERRAAQLARINELIRVVQQRLVRADTREEIEHEVCESLTGADAYRYAWVGVPDEESGVIEPMAAAGDAEGYLDDVTVRFDETPQGYGPGGEAVRTREVQVVNEAGTDGSLEHWRDQLAAYGFESLIVLPLVDGDRLHGVMPVYADRPGAFDGEERTVLAELADTVAQAITAAETRRRLEQYETVVDAVDDAVYACDETGTFVFVNDAFAALSGYDPSALVGRPVSQVFDGEDVDRVERRLPALVSSDGRNTETFEVTLRRADGTTVPCEDHVGVIPFEDEYRGTAGVVRDISDRRESERARRRLYELVADPTQEFESTCRALLEIGRDRLGLAAGKLVEIDADGGSHRTVFATNRDEENRVAALEDTYCKRVVDDGDLVALHNAGEHDATPERAYETYGHECYIGTEVVVDGEPYGSVCFTDAAPRTEGFTESERSFVELIARTVGYELERQAARERIEHREATLRRLHREVAAGDADEETLRAILDVGREALDIRCAVLSRVEGRRYEFEHVLDSEPGVEQGDVLDIGQSACERTVTERATTSVDQMAGTDEWGDKPVHTSLGMACYIGTPVVVDGELYGTLCYLGDEPRETPFSGWEETLVELLAQWVSHTLDERATREALARERDRLDEFAGALSHDLRTPLSVATGRLELAREACDCDAAEDSLAAVDDALDRMEALVTDTLALARQGETVGETEPVSLAAAARRAWEQLDAGGGTLRLDESLPTIEADPDRLRRLLENVFGNAVEHGSTGNRTGSDDAVEHGSTSPRSQAREDAVEHGSTGNRTGSDDAVEHGEQEVTVTVATAPTDGADLAFRVDDDGPGIPESERDHVFERGYSTAEDGTGFGLSIVERIASAHGWTVQLEASDTGGTRLRFTGVTAARE